MKEKVKTDAILELEKIIEPILEKEGYNLIDTEISVGKNSKITLYVYNKVKLGIDDLARLSNVLYPYLEEQSFLRENFMLEISSPGLYRNIKDHKEFDIFIGREIKIIYDDSKELNGINKGLKKDTLQILCDDKIIEIQLNDIKHAKLNG